MAKIIGNINHIDLSVSSFETIIRENNLYVDKTKFIENFLNEANSVQLVVRQRRLGKSLNMNMIYSFLTDLQDNSELFKGLYIENSSVWKLKNSAPVFLFDFKNLNIEKYKEQIFNQIAEHIYNYVNVGTLKEFQKFRLSNYMNDKGEDIEGLLLLTDLVFKTTGKRSYVLIDEYDKLLADNYNSDKYEEIKKYETQLLSAGLRSCIQPLAKLRKRVWI